MGHTTAEASSTHNSRQVSTTSNTQHRPDQLSYHPLTMSSPKKTGIQMELNVSDQLAKIIGTKKGEKISRPQCVKRLWAYLKEKELQDPENKQWFTPDDTMAPIFGEEKIKCFSMSKYLKEHLTNPDK